MKKILLFLVVMLASVMPAMADYTLQFVESTSTSDASTAYSMDVSKVFTDASNVVGEVTNVTSVYPAKKGYGAKFGSSKAAGNLKFTLLQSTYVAAILKVAAYTTTTSVTLSVNGMELPVEMPADGSPVEVTYSPGASFETMEITTAATTRFYLVSVTLVEQGTTGGGTGDPCVIKTFPWEENFDAAPITADEVIPACWDNSMGSESMAEDRKWSYYTGTLNSQCVRFDSYNNQSGEWNILKTPTMTLPQGMALFVKYKNPSGGDFNIYMYGADSATTTLKSGLVDVANWRVEKIDLSQYAGQMVSFGFEGVSNWGNGDAYIYIDKVAVMSNTQELDTESDPDFGPQIIIEEYQTLRVELARIGRVEPGWYDVMVSNMKTLPTVTSMNPDLLRIDSVRFVDGAGEAVSNPADAVSLRIHYATTPTTLGYLEGTINIVAGQISATLPFAVNVTEVYELVPLNPEEALHLTAAPGEMLTFTLKFIHTGFTPDQVSAGFPYGVSTEGYELGQLYSMNDTVMALDVHISGRKNGVYSTEVMLEAHAGVCFSDVTAYVRFETKISDSWIQKLTKEINFGVLPMNSGGYADTVYLKYHNVNLDSVVVGTNIQSYEGEPYIPCGVGNTIILNDSILAVPVECNTNIVEVAPGSYRLRFYYVVYDDGVVTDEDTDIPVKMTFVAPEFRIAEELDFGTMLFDETKSMKLQFEAQYYDISDIEVSSFSDILTVSDVIEIVDSTASTSQGAWKKYEVTVTLNAYEVGNLYQDIFCRFGSMESVVTVKAFIPQPTVTIMQEAYDFGKVPQNSGAYPAEILVTFSNALPERIGYGIRNQNEADTSWVPVGFADRVLRDSTTLVVNMMLNSDGLAVGKYDWFFFVSYGKEIYAIPVMANIVQASQIEIIPEVIDFGDVPFSSLVNDYISTEVKIATTSVHQAVASIEGDSAFSLSQFTFGPTESYFGNRLEQDLTIYALSDRMGQHMAELKLNGDSGKTVAVAQVKMNVVPRPVLYDTIRATICDNETYPFDGKMLNVAGTYSETTKTIYGGDSITTLVLTVLPTLYGDAYASIRDYEYYIFQGDTIREAGDFLYPLSKASSIGCDSIVTLHLTVLETMYRTEEATICANQSYTFYGEKYSQAGQYTHRIENTQLGDSVITLNLTVLPTKTGEDFATIRDYEVYTYQNDSLSKAGDYTYTLVAANGCDSTVTLHLTVLETMYRTENATICANQSYTFYDEVYSQTGQYEHRIENTQLGDSVITLNLTVLPTKTGEDFATIRDYEIYYYEGDSLSKAGDYTYTLVAANGCDSTVTLHLTVLETMYRTEEATICSNSSYTFYGDAYTEAGTYTHRIENTQLGDSVITLNLTVLPTKTGEDFATIRDYEIYYYEGDSLSKAGDYTYTLVAENGCDSTVTLHLTVLETMYRTENATICSNSSYTFYGDAYTEAGTYTHRIENAQLGDSVITLNLTVLPTKTGEDFATIRDYEIYYYEGDSLSKAGDYTYTLVAANGCDSTVTLHLTVLETMYRTEEATICANQSYTFYDEVYSQAGQYTHRIENTQLGDSVITLNLTVLPTKTGEANATIRDYEIYYYEGDSLSKAGDYTYTLVAANGCDSTVTLHLTVLETMYRTEEATICSNQSYTFYDEVYSQAGQYTHRIENTQLGDSVITLNLTVLPTKTVEIEATIIESETYMFGGQELTEAGVYVDTLVSTIGCDSVVTLTLRVVALCSEYVVVNEPKEVVYYGDSTDIAPVLSLVCPSHDAVIEWGRVLNYNPMADGKVDVMNPVEYETLQVASMSEYQGDTLTSIFQYGTQDRTQYFYYLVWQCDETKEMHLFHFEHVGQVNSIWVNYDAPKRDQLITSAATVSVDEANPQTVTVAWFNTTDTLTPATGNFVHGQTYYAVVTTPMTEILGENYHIDATTAIVWGEEQQPKALTNGLLRSPMYTMENVTWTFRLEDAQLAPDGQASISACAEPSVSLSDTNSVVLNWQLSIDTINWMTLSDTLGYNIDHHSYCSDIHFPATLLRAGTYYIRVRALYQGETFFSRTAELVIQAGIVMAEEAVQQTTVTETGDEVATVQYNFDETENVGVLTLTNSTNVGSPTTAVAITSNTVVEIVGTNTVLSEEAGFESSGDLEFVGRVDSTQVDEDGNTIYAALDSMSIVSRRPLYAPGQGVKVTFNGIYMTLTVYGHEDDNLVPSRSAARAQMKRAYSKAHAALEAAGDESVISGFDEADFINCGIIEPEGAEYDEDNLELMDDGDPVYNCTIAPTDIPTDPMSTGMVKDEIRAEKRIVNDVIYIFRQNKIYTMMGQSVK